MKALVYRGPGRICLEEAARPGVLDPEDAVVRVTTTSICGSDLHVLHGRMPKLAPGTVVGHEFVGVVDAVGAAVTGVRPGDRVLGPAAVWCGRCRACRRGLTMVCERRALFGCGALFGDLPGVQAEYARVPFADATLRVVPESLSDEQVLFVGDILATSYSAAAGLVPGGPGVRPGDTVAVFGAGPVGLCAVPVAKLCGAARVVAVDVEEYRLDLARRLGSDATVNPSREDPKAVIQELTAGWGAEFVIEAVGRPETLAASLAAAAPGGTVSVVGVFDGPVSLPVQRLIGRNLRLEVGLGDLAHMDRLLRLVAAGRLDLSALITHTLPLDQGERGYEIFDQKLDGAVKVLLKP